MTINDKILAHAKQEFPKECCGVINIYHGKEIYTPCRNDSDEPERDFSINPTDYSAAVDRYGDVVKIVHSHPVTNPHPSQPDLIGIENSNLPWIIVNPVTEQFTETLPTGYKAPLVGRQFVFGILDCYSIIRDYYKEELGIELLDFERKDKFWERGENLYVDNFKKAGFYEVELKNIKEHDVLIMTNGATIPSHGAVYLGDGKILHHAQPRLSSQDVFGGYWLHNLKYVLRYNFKDSAK